MRRAFLTGICLVSSGVSYAHAEPTRNLGLRLDGTCPSRELVVSELSPLLRDYQLRDESADAVAEIEDLGERYRVSVGGSARKVRDPARNCLERARVAAVFVALNLPSPTPPGAPTPVDLPPKPVYAPAPAVPPAREPPRSSASLTLELRPFASVEAAWGAGVISTGLGLGVSLRRGAFSFTLVGGATTPTTPYQPGGEAPRFEQFRYPFAALLGAGSAWGRLGLGLEVGPAFDLLGFEGQEVPNPDHAWRLNPGIRLNAVLRVRASRHFSAELLPGVHWLPRTYIVEIEPSRFLAETPRLWLGIALGLNYQMWGG